MKFHTTINSFYIQILKVRFTGPKYIKANIRYLSKASGKVLCDERNVKLMKSAMKHWEVYND